MAALQLLLAFIPLDIPSPAPDDPSGILRPGDVRSRGTISPVESSAQHRSTELNSPNNRRLRCITSFADVKVVAYSCDHRGGRRYPQHALRSHGSGLCADRQIGRQ